jgi:hypothetical protein
MTLTNKDREILATTKNNHLSLYESLGAEGTGKKLAYWQHIEKRANEWWVNQYGTAGYSAQIMKGIVKFCGYSEPRRKELVTRWLSAKELSQEELDSIGLNNWNEEMSKEEFSLQAISVFSKLSLLDEPLIIVFDQLEALGHSHNRTILLNFGEAVKEIFTHVPNSLIILNLFPNRWEQFKDIFDGSVVDRVSQYQLQLRKPSEEQLKGILKLKSQAIDVNLNSLFSSSELKIILNQNSIRTVLKSASAYYQYKVHGIHPPSDLESLSSPEDTDAVQQSLKTIKDEFIKLQEVVSNIAKALDVKGGGSEEDLVNKLIIEYLQQQRNFLEQEYTKFQIISDNDDIGKMITIAEAFKTIKSFETDYLLLGKKKLPEHLVIRNQSQSFFVGFLQIDGASFTSRIKNCNELIINNKDIRFIIYRDCRTPEIKGNVGKQEIEKLNHTSNGSFMIMDKDARINFELIYKLVTDIQNKDEEFELEKALHVLMSELKDYWLIKVFQFEKI